MTHIDLAAVRSRFPALSRVQDGRPWYSPMRRVDPRSPTP